MWVCHECSSTVAQDEEDEENVEDDADDEEDYDMEAQPFRGILAAAERAGCPLPARGAFDFSQ